MLHKDIRDLCCRACLYQGHPVLDSDCLTTFGRAHVPDGIDVNEFYGRYFLMFDHPDVDIDRPPFTGIVRPRNVELDGKGKEAASGVFEHCLTMIDDVSGRMTDVIHTVMNTCHHNRERVLIVAPDIDHAARIIRPISHRLKDRLLYIKDWDFEVDRIRNMAKFIEEVDMDDPRAPGILWDSMQRVTDRLLSEAYDRIAASADGLNFMVIDVSNLMEHMSPVEGDGRLYLDFDRILVIGAEELNIVDTMPLYAFGKPIAFFYGPLSDRSFTLPDDLDPNDVFPVVLSSRYAESMLFNTPSQMAEHVRTGSGPQLWKSVVFEV